MKSKLLLCGISVSNYQMDNQWNGHFVGAICSVMCRDVMLLKYYGSSLNDMKIAIHKVVTMREIQYGL